MAIKYHDGAALVGAASFEVKNCEIHPCKAGSGKADGAGNEWQGLVELMQV